jgi:hypothetical protein
MPEHRPREDRAFGWHHRTRRKTSRRCTMPPPQPGTRKRVTYMDKPFNPRELEFLARLRAWSRNGREGLSELVRDGFLTREAATCLALGVEDALLVASLADHASWKSSVAAECTESELRRYLVSGLLKPLTR